MSISLIIPIHNAENDIVNTLNSVCQSLTENDELILVFDNCQDGSFKLCQNWNANVGGGLNILMYEVSFGAVSLSRNFGIKKASKKWITFADHDDLVAPSIYKDLLLQAEYNNVDVVRAGFVEKHSHQEVAVYPDFPLDTYPFFGIFIWNSLFRRELLIDNNIEFIPGYGEDYEFNLYVARYAKSQEFLHKCLYYWRLHDNNQHKKRKPEDFFFRIQSILGNHIDYLLEVPNASYAFVKWYLNYLGHLNNIFSYKEMTMAAQDYQSIMSHLNILKSKLDKEHQQAISFWTTRLW